MEVVTGPRRSAFCCEDPFPSTLKSVLGLPDGTGIFKFVDLLFIRLRREEISLAMEDVEY